MTTTAPQFPTTMTERLSELNHARTALMAELEDGNFDSLYAETGRWSIGELAYHLYLVEARITGLLKHLLGSPMRNEPASEETLRTEWTLTNSRANDPEIRSQAPAGTI